MRFRSNRITRIIKISLSGLGILILTGLLFFSGIYVKYRRIVDAEPRYMPDAAKPELPLVKAVNPFIGTGGYHWVCGHNFPGASVPFGMVRLGPETVSLLTGRIALNTSGHFYRDQKIQGFSHTSLCGTGAKDGGHFLVVPVRGPISGEKRQKAPLHRFSHSDEVAFPGYYAVYLRGPDVLAEMTATGRVGIHRYTFSDGKQPHLLIDVCHALGDGRSTGGEVKIVPEACEMEGTVRTFGTYSKRYGGIRVYFVARFDQAFDTHGVWHGGEFHSGKESAEGDDIGVELGFAEQGSRGSIGLKLAISYVSLENARENLEAEAGERTFEDILGSAQRSWEDRLSLIRISGTTDAQKEIFYTALYRAFQMPTVVNDGNGEYFGFDRQVHQATGFRYFTDLSLWDTFRTIHPLYNIIAQEDQRDMMVSLVRMAKEGGWLPRWPSGNRYTGSMLGTPADITIADAWLKGIRDFNIGYAYRSMWETALGPTAEDAGFSGRRGIGPYLEYGYCPADMMDEAVSKTLEYAWADHAIAQLAASLGKQDDARLFQEHAGFYRNTWNPETGYFHPRNTGGDFVTEFKPFLLTYFDRKGKYTDDYVEGSALQWRWAVPFDTQGLISLFDSPESFVTELNDFFAMSDPAMGAWNPGPYYWHGNEPDIHAAYLFNEAGRPDLTQKWVRWVLEHKYGTGYDGLDGNDDGGTLSAWYIFSSLGFYPMTGTDIYQLGTPLFRKVEVNMDGKILRIEAENYTPENFYVGRVRLNDVVLDRTWIRYSEIARGERCWVLK
jgi:predicted alpha-1,2-mannosidase